MKDKVVRLVKALSNESVRRLPYIIFVGITIVFIQFVRLNNQTADGVMIAKNNSIDNQTLLKKVAALSQDNKDLNKQNNRIAKENAAHLDCVAALFAKYTRDGLAITRYDLETCFIKSEATEPQATFETSDTSQTSESPQSLSNPSVPSSQPPNTNTATPNNTPTISQPQPEIPQQPSFLEQVMDLGRNLFNILGL